jgi:hypothetical protein
MSDPEQNTTITPAHQWTDGGTDVLIVKCVNADLTSHGGFVWPESGEVTTPTWSPEPTCESGGLFGWAWGLGMGGGKNPDYSGRWIVFAAAPGHVVDLGEKCKAGPTARVVYCGTWYGALSVVRDGQRRWIEHASRGAAAATGPSGAAAATGPSGAAAATGSSGAAAATGWSGAAAATGWSGAAAATGQRGAAAATGWSSTVEAGPGGIAACTADFCYWRVRHGAVFVQTWRSEEGEWKRALHDSTDFPDGSLVQMNRGVAKVMEASNA